MKRNKFRAPLVAAPPRCGLALNGAPHFESLEVGDYACTAPAIHSSERDILQARAAGVAAHLQAGSRHLEDKNYAVLAARTWVPNHLRRWRQILTQSEKPCGGRRGFIKSRLGLAGLDRGYGRNRFAAKRPRVDQIVIVVSSNLVNVTL